MTAACAVKNCAREQGHEGEHREWLTHDEARAQGVPQSVIDAAVAEADLLIKYRPLWWPR